MTLSSPTFDGAVPTGAETPRSVWAYGSAKSSCPYLFLGELPGEKLSYLMSCVFPTYVGIPSPQGGGTSWHPAPDLLHPEVLKVETAVKAQTIDLSHFQTKTKRSHLVWCCLCHTPWLKRWHHPSNRSQHFSGDMPMAENAVDKACSSPLKISTGPQ